MVTKQLENEENNNGAIIAGILLGVAAAAGVGVAKYLHDLKIQISEENAKKLISDQEIYDVFSGTDAAVWFKEKTGLNAKGKLLIITKLTGKFKNICTLPPELDREHYLLLIIIDKSDKKKIEQIQLVNFASLSDELRKKLDEDDGVIVVEG